MKKLLLIICLLSFVSSIFASTYTVPSDFMSYGKWKRLEQRIDKDQDKTITLLWRGDGGDDEYGTKWAKWVNNSKKDITYKVVGEAFSEHAMVICYTNRPVVYSGGVLIFHPGKESPEGPYIPVKEDRKAFAPCVSKGYLTKKDVDKIVLYKMQVWVYKGGKKRYKLDQ